MVLLNYDDAIMSYIQDDDKLVTYKYLSKEFEIHVNLAKIILKRFWEKYKNENKIVATFVLIGSLLDKSIRIEIVQDLNLNVIKKKFINIDCEHLYSLQKSLQHTELLVLAGEGDFYYSAIKGNDYNIKYNKEIAEQHSQYTEGIKIERHTTKINNSNYDSLVQNKIENTKNNIFHENNVSKSSTNLKLINSYTKIKMPILSSCIDVNNSFKKELNKIEVINKEQNYNDIIQENSLYQTKIEIQPTKMKKTFIKTDKVISKKNSINLYGEQKTICMSKNNDIKSCKLKNNIALKRKRFIIDSSEEEFDNTDHNNEQIKDKISEIVTVKPPVLQSVKHDNNKPIIKTIIDKTYTDENGYFVTKRVNVRDIGDNDEFIELKNQESHKSQPIEIKSKKQTTLTYFFKQSN